MARTVNPATHALRRDEFIEAGQRLIQTRGYEQFSLEDLLTDVGASKGAFYHYFSSKVELLAAIVDRLVESAMAVVGRVVDDDRLSATQKFREYFGMIASFKAEQRDFLVQLMQVWYSDDNAIVREKLRREQIKRVTPHLAAIIRQGIAEGAFILADPDQMARVVLALMLDAGEEAGELFLKRQAGAVELDIIRRRFETYQQALERLLGTKPGELRLIDDSMLRLWFDQPTVTNQRNPMNPQKESK